jgi:hypothetical protein
MVRQSKEKMEKIFTKLPEYGYSESAAETIWRWYHPPCIDKTKSSPKEKPTSLA